MSMRVMAWDAVLRCVILTIVGLALGGCEAKSGSDREKARTEIAETDELYRSAAPLIPESQAVGCDVCPRHCRSVDLSVQMPMDKLLSEYRRIAVERTMEGEAWRVLMGLGCLAARKGVASELEFLQLLADEREEVRYYAARQALDLGFAIEKPIAILKEVADSKAPYRASAWARVMLWQQVEDGEWPPNAHRLKRQQRPHVR